ncbi:MAG: hypothetical protein ACOC83_02675 [Gemmatimonadota bacterium]
MTRTAGRHDATEHSILQAYNRRSTSTMNDSQSLRDMVANGGRSLLVACLAAAFAITSAPAQEQGQTDQSQQEATTPRAELQQIVQQLQPLEQQAIQQDESLMTRAEELQGTIDEAMRGEDAEFMDRFEELQQELQQAQENQDSEQMQQLMGEWQQAQTTFQEIRAEVMRRDDISEQVESFADDIEAQIIEIDPEAEELIERRDSLVEEIESQQDTSSDGGEGSGGGG